MFFKVIRRQKIKNAIKQYEQQRKNAIENTSPDEDVINIAYLNGCISSLNWCLND